jgi:uncharacterized membrane protein HdeD (DUF308 family)
MSTNQFTGRLLTGVDEIRSSWGWFLFLGILLMVLGAVCIVSNITATFATVLFFGWLLLFSGIAALIQAFRVHTWNGFFLYLLNALLRGFTGYLLIRYPLSGAVSLTLILASFFIVGGLFRAIAAGTLKFPRWAWSAVSGVVSMVLGIILLMQMPASSVWFIGFCIGVDLIFDGASLVSFAAAIHNLPKIVGFKAA